MFEMYFRRKIASRMWENIRMTWVHDPKDEKKTPIPNTTRSEFFWTSRLETFRFARSIDSEVVKSAETHPHSAAGAGDILGAEKEKRDMSDMSMYCRFS